jgi:hypothetical protein
MQPVDVFLNWTELYMAAILLDLPSLAHGRKMRCHLEKH